MPKYMNRERYMTWEEKGRPSMASKLTKKAKEIVESECPIFTDEKLNCEFDRIIAEHEEFYGI